MCAYSGAHNELGSLGEDLAAEFLISKGYVLLERNLDLKVGEIDLLMREGESVVLVEVKTSKRLSTIDPIYRISPAKQRKLRLLGSIISSRFPENNVRVDAVTLYWEGEKRVLKHFENI